MILEKLTKKRDKVTDKLGEVLDDLYDVLYDMEHTRGKLSTEIEAFQHKANIKRAESNNLQNEITRTHSIIDAVREVDDKCS